MSLDEKRMVLSQTARVATWHATSASPDEATPRSRKASPSKLVEPVSRLADLAAARYRLGRFLRPLVASDPWFRGEPEISSESARTSEEWP